MTEFCQETGKQGAKYEGEREREAAAIEAELAAMAAETERWQKAAGGPIVEVMAKWVSSQYLLAVKQELARQTEGPERLKLLRQMAGDVVALQRGASWAPRLQLDRERLELARQKHSDAMSLAREAAAAPKEARKMRDPKLSLSDEDRLAIIDKVDRIMGIK